MTFKEALTFDDVLILPKFSTIRSRKDVDLDLNFPHSKIKLPVISANMDTVTGAVMAKAMSDYGGIGCLHRFCTIEENVSMFKNSYSSNHSSSYPMVSVGLGSYELERAEALMSEGADIFVIDVANGASISVTEQVKELRSLFFNYNLHEAQLIVGNFATSDSVKTFLEYCGDLVDGFKIGIGPGSSCSTRIKTGIGYPQLSAVLDIVSTLKNTGISVIADGGIRSAGDVAKALGAGADAVMIGGMFAGTTESPGELVNSQGKPLKFLGDGTVEVDEWITHPGNVKVFKKYRGSASKESYIIQGKDESWRAAEGESFLVPYKGPVKDVLADIEGGLKSAFSYVGAQNLEEFHAKVEFVKVTNAGYIEGTPHGKK